MGVGEPDPAEDLRLLRLHIASMFALSPTGRILRESEPDNSPGPRLFFAGCAGGNLVRARHDVSDRTVLDAVALTEAEPPWRDPDILPDCLDGLVALMSRDAAAEAATPALIYRLPNGLAYDSGATIVRSDRAEGARLLARLTGQGMPPHLVQAGFVGLDDFWEPWCAAMEGREIAALAFAARIGAGAMDVGVYTFPGFRGRGLAAAVTAAWSFLPGVAKHTLFYSHLATNLSSGRVAARLGLRRIGVSVRIG